MLYYVVAVNRTAEKLLRNEIFFCLIAMRNRDLFGQYQLTEYWTEYMALSYIHRWPQFRFNSFKPFGATLSQDLEYLLYSSTLHRRYPSRSTRNRPRDSYCLSFPVVIITDKSLSSGWRFNVEPDALHPY